MDFSVERDTDHSAFYNQMVDDFTRLGIRADGVLLVHSSLRSLGLPAETPGRAGSVVAALLQAIGAEGTLLMPALSYETVRSTQPFFDVSDTPSCVGALTEYFRCRPGVIRSVHPTHSVCGFGKLAQEILGNHQLDTTPCGQHSPFAKLPGLNGQILFLGCGLRPNTSMHAIEEHIEPVYLFGDDVDYTIRLADGSQSTMRVRRHNFRGWEQRYERLEHVMQAGIRKGAVLNAACYLVEADQMWPAALRALRENPLYFVERT